MSDIKPSAVIEDSHGNRYFFYYKDNSICYKEVANSGETKDTILISQVNSDFAVTIDTDNTLYLICNSRYKGLLLFYYNSLGWRFEQVINVHNSSALYLMDILVINSSIHVFFLKKLPIANMHTVYHMIKDANEQNSFPELSWKKSSLSEIYAQNIDNAYSLLHTKNGCLHFSCVWYDGTNYFINYYCYDSSTKAWTYKTLQTAYKSYPYVKLIYHNKNINLLCFISENGNNFVQHFVSKAANSNSIEFKQLYMEKVDTVNIVPVFFYDDKSVHLSWIKDSVYFQYTLDDSAYKWNKNIELPVNSDMSLIYMSILKNSGTVHVNKGYFLIDKSYKIIRPLEINLKNYAVDTPKEKGETISNDMNEYAKEILNEIKALSENVKHLSSRLESLEKTDSRKNYEGNAKQDKVETFNVRQSNTIENQPLKKTAFKEKFMKSNPLPSYESLLEDRNNVSVFASKPGDNKKKTAEASQSKKPDDMYSSVPARPTADAKADNIQENPAESKYNNIFKKIGEFFK
ncbi:MAG: hypothetical protein ACM3TR_09075 [Caulobacteraceae bacterium]